MRRIAVLTGDIVKSTQLSSESMKEIQSCIRNIPSEFNRYYPKSVIENVSIHRGDGWQIALKKYKYALRLALYIKSVLKSKFKVDTRVSIGVGTVDFLDEKNISSSTGAAFNLSGQGLDDMRKNHLLSYNSAKNHLGSSIRFLDLLVQKQTQKQNTIFMHALLGLSQSDISRKIKSEKTPTKTVSQQAISKVLDKLHWEDIQEFMKVFEQ